MVTERVGATGEVMSATLILIPGLIVLGGVTAGGVAASRSEAGRKIREENNRKLSDPKYRRRVRTSQLVSNALVVAFAVGLGRLVIHVKPEPIWRMALEVVAILMLYDFMYYLMHRFLFHGWAVLRRVHAVHHTARRPTAMDSLLLHPVENFLGLALFALSLCLVGPVHLAAFAVAFSIYSGLNIVNHAHFDLPFFPFRTASYLARTHAKHHLSMKHGNYSTITPLFDLLFGTLE
jgi:sterol desaturase/sphingolipid hydroxylase (fatty acid hydroxylase superfamily)